MSWLACLILSGCSSGAATDARHDEARDASLKDQLAAEQATWTAQHYFPPTATPGPAKPLTPSLGDVAITFGFKPDGTPDGSYASVPAGAGTAFVGVELAGVSAGQKVRAVVTDGWGNDVAAPESVVGPGSAQQWLALPVPLANELRQASMASLSSSTINRLAPWRLGLPVSARLRNCCRKRPPTPRFPPQSLRLEWLRPRPNLRLRRLRRKTRQSHCDP